MENRQRIGFVVAGLLLGIFIAAIDNTIVSTAMGTIVAELGGLDKFVWVTSAYLVTEMAGMPIFGKLSDMYGRKRFFVFGLLLFLIGSVLCGMAQNIVQLSLFRAIQGIGGGALMPIAFAIVFDIYSPEQRGKMSGMFGAVFGLSSVIGPLLGAYITDTLDWRWNFYINLPLGILALVFVAYFYHESHEHSQQKIDWWGAFTLVIAVVSLMFALELGGRQYAWDSAVILGLFAVFAVMLAVFLLIERKAAEPIISYRMFANRLFATSSAAAFLYGGTFIIATVYIPIFMQGVMGGTATNSGLVLLPMMLGVTAAAQIGGFLSVKIGYRKVMVASTLVFILSLCLLATLTPQTGRFTVILYMIICGLGIGSSFSVLNMAAIHHFEYGQRGSASSTNSFLRAVGMTVGITIFGILQRNDFLQRLTDALGGSAGLPSGVSLQDPRAILAPETRALIPEPILRPIIDALSGSIAQTFRWAILPACLILVIVSMMGREKAAGFAAQASEGKREKPLQEA
ncbi:MFS transporter [Brevibacillus sp. SYP-B805]|uniref:MDR family MFS transporter n=1 Tax=Brevibacillus sp. SYP-B805 TaxID=1578199 RepID=UPI0013ECA773|nr:MDR family MFS transporter [Brevibacillus sp. SYP-B805]NGQ95848.1 MFS transporter [Brevibacillus sp. SYP-B805]